MKKLISILFFILVTNFSMSQTANVSYPTDKVFRYGGPMTNELFSYLSVDEKDAYLQCVKLCGLNPDSILWIKGDMVQKIADNLEFCSERVSWVSTEDKEGITEVIVKGQNSLDKPQCIVFINRQYDVTKFTFQMYY